ncbi:lmo0937 family membrane protein [Sporosarcina sp. CAU 1771]
MGRILWLIIMVLIAFWVIGLVAKIGGGLIHFLLLIAGVIFIIQLISGKRSV